MLGVWVRGHVKLAGELRKGMEAMASMPGG